MASTLKNKLVKGTAAIAAVGTVASIALIGAGSANADPQQITNSFYGYGSDTIQDVTNAFAGFSNGVNFTPLQTDSPRQTQLVSWDAFGSDCIVPATGAPQIVRPNGSGNGQRILAAANVAGETWPLDGAATACGPALGTSGFVDFSRSSSGPGSRQDDAGPLQWLPFGRDALSFAFANPSGTFTTQKNLTSAELIALHDTGPQLIDGTPVIACGIQTGSGTYGTWMGDLGLSDDPPFGDATGTSLCNSIADPGIVDQDPTNGFRLQENNSPELIIKANKGNEISDDVCDGVLDGNAATCEDAQFVIGYSASQFIARYNEVVGAPESRLDSVNGGIGSIDALGFPVQVESGSGTVDTLVGDETLSPDGSYYADGNYGRDVYFIVPIRNISGFFADSNLQDMFLSTGSGAGFEPSKICAATATIQQHGFLSLGDDCMQQLDSLRGNFRTS